MSATLRYAFLFVPAVLLAGQAEAYPYAGSADATGPSAAAPGNSASPHVAYASAHSPYVTPAVATADPPPQRAFHTDPAAPAGFAETDERTIHDQTAPYARRRGDGASAGALSPLAIARSANRAVRALACDLLRIEFDAARHAERANRNIFGSTAPPLL